MLQEHQRLGLSLTHPLNAEWEGSQRKRDPIARVAARGPSGWTVTLGSRVR